MQAKLLATAAGDTTIIAAASGFFYRIIKLFAVASGNVTIKFLSGANDLTGGMAVVAGAVFDLQGQDKHPWMTTNAGEAFIVNLSGIVNVGGIVVYEKVPV